MALAHPETDFTYDNPDHITATPQPKPTKPLDFQPRNDFLVVRVEKAEARSKGGIILTDEGQLPPVEGRVVAASPGYYQNGTFIALQFRLGDWVRFGRWVHSGDQVFEHEGEKLLLLRENDVIGTVPSKTAQNPASYGTPIESFKGRPPSFVG